MAPAASADVAALRQQLAARNLDYLCSPEPPGDAISVRFIGRFDGEEIVWNMTLRTLGHWQRSQGRTESEPARQFMQIDRDADGSLRIEVALAVTTIDQPAIRKTIVMIRNYKRLRVGRHEWGGR
jgi:hypothetical protein